MKRIALLFITAIISSASYAQHYLDVGVHGGFGSTWLINNNVSDQGSNLDPEISFAGFGGIHAAVSFAPSIGLKVEADMATIKQKYKSESLGVTAEGYDKLHFIEVPVLILLKSSAFYCEIGPKFSFLSSAKGEVKTDFPLGAYSDRDIKPGFKKTAISGVVGLGGTFPLTPQKNLMLTAGLRFSYGFTDVTKEYSSEPALDADGSKTGIATNGAHFDQDGNFSYKATHIATGYLVVGLSYRIPFGNR